MRTPGLWRYLVIRGGPYKNLRNRIKRCGTLLLDVAVYASKGNAQLTRLLLPILPRLESLTFAKSFSGKCLLDILQHPMPQLMRLEVDVEFGHKHFPIQFEASLFPAIRILRASRYLKWWDHPTRLPETLNVIAIDRCTVPRDRNPVTALRDFLPFSLQHFHFCAVDMPPLERPSDGPIRLEQLESIVMQLIAGNDIHLLHYIHAPALETVHITYSSFRPVDNLHDIDWTLDFPTLLHLQWEVSGRSSSQTIPSLPPLHKFLQSCSSLILIHIYSSTGRIPEVFHLVEALAANPSLLPNLEDIKLLGASILSLEKAVRARPKVEYVDIHRLDIGLTHLATREEFKRWEEAVDWLASKTELSFDFSYGREFYMDGMDRYQSWEDMKRGVCVDHRDWESAVIEDGAFYLEIMEERLRISDLEVAELRQQIEEGREWMEVIREELERRESD